MRAKFAFALAAFGLMVSSQPSIASDNLLYDVQKILSGGNTSQRIMLTQPAILHRNACTAAPASTVVAPGAALITGSNQMLLREIPAVLAPTSTGVAIITEIPSDLDIRREDLGRRIDEAMGVNALSSCQATEMKSALSEVGNAEVAMRSDGLLNNYESRRLYRAMDRIGSDLDYYTNPGSGRFLGFRLVPWL